MIDVLVIDDPGREPWPGLLALIRERHNMVQATVFRGPWREESLLDELMKAVDDAVIYGTGASEIWVPVKRTVYRWRGRRFVTNVMQPLKARRLTTI